MRKGEVGGDSVETEARAREAEEWQSPTNEVRALWGQVTLQYYVPLVGDQGEPTDWQMVDLLADLMHFGRREKLDFDNILDRARRHFDTEVREEGQK